MGLLIDTLRSLDVLSGLPDETIERFMVLGRSTERRKGTVIWRAGEPSSGVLVPITGELKLTATDEQGREVIESLRSSGELIGLASTLDGMPHPCDAVVTRSGEFFTVPATSFRAFLAEVPQAHTAALRLLGRRLRRFIREREEMALMPVGQRLARYLLSHACVRQSDGAKILLSATQSEIAARLGTVREVVARSLAGLLADGVLEKTSHGTYVSNWDGLCQAAGIEPGTIELARVLDDEAPTPQVRTERFFLPMAEPRRLSADRNPEHCEEHLGDVKLCRQKGCPGARRLGHP